MSRSLCFGPDYNIFKCVLLYQLNTPPKSASMQDAHVETLLTPTASRLEVHLLVVMVIIEYELIALVIVKVVKKQRVDNLPFMK